RASRDGCRRPGSSAPTARPWRRRRARRRRGRRRRWRRARLVRRRSWRLLPDAAILARAGGGVIPAAAMVRASIHRGGSIMASGATGIVPFWKNYDRKAVLRFAQLAEDLGYDSIWIPEAWAYEQFQLLAEVALATKRIKLATGIANVFSRSAGLVAMSVATLSQVSAGRAIL